MNREWASIGGDWLGLGQTSFGDTGLYDQNGNFNPYTTAPNSAHVLWTKPEAFGGQIGGQFGGSDTAIYATGTAYETKFAPVILYGVLYYTAYPGAKNNPGPLTAVDLRTGQTLWTKDIGASSLRCGMVLNFATGDQYGAHAYLFTAPSGYNGWTVPMIPNQWQMYDAMTGNWILNIANASAGTLVAGSNGEILSYTVANGMLTMWNSSKCIAEGSTKNNIYLIYSAAEIWRPPQGATIDWSPGIEWRAPLATNISGVPIIPPLGVSKISDDVVLTVAQPGGVFGGVPGGAQLGYEIEAGYSAKDGHLLWGPVNRTLTPFTNVVCVAAGEGVYTEYNNQEMTWIGYSIKTGEKLWGPTQPYNSSWGYYDFSGHGVIGYGNFYTWGLTGEVYAWDVQTGVLKWSWYAGNAGIDTPYGTWPLGVFGGYDLADGKLYLAAGHDYTPPVFKGAKIYALNATTGDLIWDSLCFSMASSPAVADGVMVKLNGYDNQIYGYGKGPSSTTVTAPDVGVTTATPITIRGTVIDISAGTQQQAQAANFPHGVPAVSDASQSAWMEYVYQQQTCPATVTGVPVDISVLDSNGNYRNIGTATSDGSGTFALTWTPDIPGDFTVVATFAGSESYYPSNAETHFTATVPAPTAAPTAAPLSGIASNDTLMYGIVAIIIVIIIVGAVLAILVTRKRP
jgi:outer membrane protein assembly factor BamB